MHKRPQENQKLDTTDPPILLAMLIAARRTGDKILERVARRELETKHAIRIAFGEAVPHAAR